MKENRKLIISFLVALMFSVGFAASAAGLIPCGSDGEPMCQACHIVQMGQKILVWIISIMTSIIAFIFMLGGFNMVMAGSNPGRVGQAKSMMTKAVVGFVILLASWLIIDTFLKFFVDTGKIGTWNEIKCVDQPVSTTSATTPTPGVTTSTTAAGKLSDADARTQLQNAGIGINKTEAQGTSLNNINAATIQDAIDLKKDCNCDITITGGTEGTGGHSTSQTGMGHADGYKYDIRLNDTLNTYITTNFTYSGVRSDGAAMYTAKDGTVYAKEGDHWDVKVTSS